MIKTTLKTVMLLGVAVSGLAFAAGPCEFCTLRYEQCLRVSHGPLVKTPEQCWAEYQMCREMDCPSP
ncbi:hypothetical protein [uncultured Stenotrophomonas sp.]|jgi:hypothetical protein|uniref:hypothetical protein n=1 Tax=uncultured Stenotrophomonas sp. TaxID=165438 RepID=UPI0025E145B6|nr:hypothetical protein [uncultured Stenotrophomonas sp.]HDS1578677.1 hypothetical protein [Stenotrophomonas maltophilia]